MRDSLGSDSLNKGKILGVFLGVPMILFLMNWMVANSTESVKSTASFYIVWGLVFFVVFLADYLVVKKGGKQFNGADIPDTVTYEDQSPLGFVIPKWGKVAILLGSILLGAWIFFNVGSKPTMAIVSAPTFSAVDIGASGSALLSALSGHLEDLMMWSFVGPTLFGIGFALSRHKIIGLAAAGGITPFIFMIYHISRYGASPTALDSVLLFGFVAMMLTILFGSILPATAIHAGNNAGIVYFSSTSADVSGYFLIFVGFIAILAILYFIIRRKRRK